MNPSERLALIRRVLLIIGSCGWLLPLWGAYDSYLEFIENQVVAPLHNYPHVASFGYKQFSSALAEIAAIWLAVVIAHWVWVVSARAAVARPAA